MNTAEIRHTIFNDAAFMGIRAAVGVIFIVHGMGKFNPGFAQFLPNLGLPPEMQIPIALAEVVPGILLLIGVLSRFSGALLAIIMMGAIFHVKGAANFTGERGTELDIILLAGSLLIMVAGPGRISLVHAVARIPRIFH